VYRHIVQKGRDDVTQEARKAYRWEVVREVGINENAGLAAGAKSLISWSRWPDLNRRPADYESLINSWMP
jgi:hypothetical protein